MKAENTSEEQGGAIGSAQDFCSFNVPKFLLLSRTPGFSHMTGFTLKQCRWKISPLSIQKSICKLLPVDLFSCSSAGLMLCTHSFFCNQQLHKGDAQETLSTWLIAKIQFLGSMSLIYQLILHLQCCHFALLWVLEVLAVKCIIERGFLPSSGWCRELRRLSVLM